MGSVVPAGGDFSDWREGGVCSTHPERGACFQRLVFSLALHKGTTAAGISAWKYSKILPNLGEWGCLTCLAQTEPCSCARAEIN